jgi:hypothetical protein
MMSDSREVSTRTRGIIFEAEYWQAVLADVVSLHENIGQVADNLASASVAVLTITTAPAERRHEFALDAMETIRASMELLLPMQKRLTSIVDLMGGRVAALQAEVDGLSDDETGGWSVRVP